MAWDYLILLSKDLARVCYQSGILSKYELENFNAFGFFGTLHTPILSNQNLVQNRKCKSNLQRVQQWARVSLKEGWLHQGRRNLPL
jgi:hypothetical protein